MQWDKGTGLINNVGSLKGTYRYGKTTKGEILKSDDIDKVLNKISF